MKRMILTIAGAFAAAGGTANAADMPVKARPMAVAAAYDWTGFYIGGHAGGLWERSEFSASQRDVLFPGFVASARLRWSPNTERQVLIAEY